MVWKNRRPSAVKLHKKEVLREGSASFFVPETLTDRGMDKIVILTIADAAAEAYNGIRVKMK